jgi:beta-lactamase class A
MPKILIIYLIAFIFSANAKAQQNAMLFSKIDSIAKLAKGKVCVSALNIETKDSIDYYGDEHCAMQSVFKFPIALAILDKIDKGEFSLQHKIYVKKEDYNGYSWSPMRDSFPNGNMNFTFETLIKYMVSQSDNSACDILLHHLGKPKKVEKYLHKIGIEDIAIKYNEVGMHKNWNNQYKNWSTTNAMNQLLLKLFEGKILSKTNTDFIYKTLIETSTGKNRITKLLPLGTIVAHKTGSSDTNKEGITAAVNDVGIITLPNGQHLILSIFISDAKAEYDILESTIAEIAKVIFDNYNKN